MRILPITALVLFSQLAFGQTSLFTSKIKKNLTETAPRIERVQTTFKPDTIVVFNRSGVTPMPDTRIIYQYDAQQRPTRIDIESIDTGFWTIFKRLEVQYNAAGLPSRSDIYELQNGILTLLTRRERSYTAQGRVVLNKVTDFVAGSGANISGDSLVYNGAGANPTSIDAYYFDSNTNSWTQAIRFRNFVFNNANQLTQAAYATQVGAVYVDILRAQNIDWKAGYPGLDAAVLGEEFDPMIPDDFRWEPRVITWSGPSNILVQENNLTSWTNVNRLTQTLAGTQLASITEEDWNDTIATPAWESFKRNFFTFTSNQLTELSSQYFMNNSFVNDVKENVVLAGPQGLPTRYETFTWLGNSWNQDNLNTFSYSLDNQSRLRYMAKTMSVFGTQMPADSLVFQYRATTSTNDIPAVTAQIFPNPSTQGWAQIRFEQPFTGNLILRDLTGKLMIQQVVQGETNINLNVAGLAKGLYLVQWTDSANRSNTCKLLIQ